MFFIKMCPSGGTRYGSFALVLGILRGPGKRRGGAPGTAPLQVQKVTSRKACLRNADLQGPARAPESLANVLNPNPHRLNPWELLLIECWMGALHSRSNCDIRLIVGPVRLRARPEFFDGTFPIATNREIRTFRSQSLCFLLHLRSRFKRLQL